jgi:hypothetical protein
VSEMRRQTVEKVAKPEKRKIGEKALRTLTQITKQMRIVYCEMRNDQLDIQKGGTLIRALERLRLATASTIYDARLDRLEEYLDERDRRVPGSGNGYYGDDDDDRRDMLQ